MKTYKEVLSIIESASCENHLLLGNGFNLSLGVDTSYEKIFELMRDNFNVYNELKIENENYDVEFIIGKLKEQINEGDLKPFLEKFINNKIKLDFMKSAYQIVKSQIKDIYNEKNGGLGLLFKNFNNYFSLNYDPLLYLVLMKYRENKNILTFQNTLKFKVEDNQNKEVFSYLEIYNNWTKKLVGPQNKAIEKPLSELTKVDFTNQLKQILKSQGKAINQQVLELAYEKLKENFVKLTINDGYNLVNNDLIFNRFQNQNVFFLHGAFHIYEKKNKLCYKITQTQNKALYEKLETILNDENQEIICVFTNENKIGKINENQYLKKGFDELAHLKGKLMIIGSSIDQNDQHIFNQINLSSINEIYYASSFESEISDLKRLNRAFVDKKITLFDRKTISYD